MKMNALMEIQKMYAKTYNTVKKPVSLNEKWTIDIL